MGTSLLLVQLAGLLAWSYHLWSRFDLTADFGTAQQAWQQIATGHLDPELTTSVNYYPHWGYPFWQSHFEVAMWPLALLWWVSHSSFTLLVVQDLALCASGLLTLRWGLELLETHWPERTRGEPLVSIALLVVLLVSPWTYWTASFDWHFEPIACAFLLAAGRDLWRGRSRGWWWVAGVLACGDVASTYVLAAGASFLLFGRRRHCRRGLVLLACGLAWLALIGAVGASKGSSMSAAYAYLARGHVGLGLAGIAAIAAGLTTHPGVAVQMAWTRRDEILKYLYSTGTISVLSTIALPMTVVVLGASVLNQAPNYIAAPFSFQNLAAVWFLALGMVAVSTWLARRGRAGPAIAGVFCILAAVQAVYVSALWTPKAAKTFSVVPAVTARQLARVEAGIPVGDEVVVSQGVFGRFSAHQWAYPFFHAFSDGQTVPVKRPTVVFVFTDAGLEFPSPSETRAIESFVADRLHARVVTREDGVVELQWHPARGQRFVNIPRLPALSPS